MCAAYACIYLLYDLLLILYNNCIVYAYISKYFIIIRKNSNIFYIMSFFKYHVLG